MEGCHGSRCDSKQQPVQSQPSSLVSPQVSFPKKKSHVLPVHLVAHASGDVADSEAFLSPKSVETCMADEASKDFASSPMRTSWKGPTDCCSYCLFSTGSLSLSRIFSRSLIFARRSIVVRVTFGRG